jgi:ferredoxin
MSRTRRPSLRKALPAIDAARCTGCGWCVSVCPPHVLSLQANGGRKTSNLHDAAACTGCALCALRCPFDAIEMRRLTHSGAVDPISRQVDIQN